MMPPYIHLQAIHDQQIQEALEHQHYEAGQERHRQSLLQAFGKLLTRRFGAQQEATLPDCSGIEELPDTTLQTFRMLVPYEPAVEERDAACA